MQDEILIVDDDSINQVVMQMMLKNLNLKFSSVTNGIDAIESYKKNLYKVILMDFEMPELDGFETTKKIRAISKNEFSPIIIGISAHLQEKMVQKALDSGMNDYIGKPVSLLNLQKKLDYWLKEIYKN